MAKTQAIEAIVLSAKNFGEADKLLTVFSKEHGKMKLLAKGVRKIKSRKGGNVDILNDVQMHIVYGHSLPIITEAQAINSFLPLKENLSAAMYASYIVELINVLTVEQQEQIELFYLLKQTLQTLAKAPRRIIIHAFEIKLLASIGFWSVSDLVEKDQKLLELARKMEVQSFEKLAQENYDTNDIVAVGQITRKRLEFVAEQEFKSPKVLTQLRQSLQQAEG